MPLLEPPVRGSAIGNAFDPVLLKKTPAFPTPGSAPGPAVAALHAVATVAPTVDVIFGLKKLQPANCVLSGLSSAGFIAFMPAIASGMLVLFPSPDTFTGLWEFPGTATV